MPEVHAYVYEVLFTKRNEACRIIVLYEERMLQPGRRVPPGVPTYYPPAQELTQKKDFQKRKITK